MTDPCPFTAGQLYAIAAILTVTGTKHPDHGDARLARLCREHADQQHQESQR